MNKGGFSWKRFLGITKIKRDISRKTGIPTSKSGRQQKIGRLVTKGCFGTLLTLMISLMTVLIAFLILI